MVELREIRSIESSFQTTHPNTTDSPLPEEMSPESTWKSYLKDAEKREHIDPQTYESLLQAGMEILEEIDTNGMGLVNGLQYDLKLKRTTIHGFGPFVESVTYPLHNRGLVLLRGMLKTLSAMNP
jgi:hypothetical protein